jgi:hypothetical protein
VLNKTLLPLDYQTAESMHPIKTIFKTHHLMERKYKAISNQRQEKVTKSSRDFHHSYKSTKILRQLNQKICMIKIISLAKIQ